MSKSSHTHARPSDSFSKIVDNLREIIIYRGNLPYVSVEKQLEIIDDLCSFPLGRFFLERKGANGFWTDCIINYSKTEAITSDYCGGDSPSFVERFILEKSPLTLATRERYKIFQACIEKSLKNRMTLASIPCGVMRDLLSLDFSNLSIFSLIGVDLDSESLFLAEQLARDNSLDCHIKLIQEDAWNLKFKDQVDLITSNGLNVYISDPQKILSLYKKFYEILKDDGTLIIGVLTHPPYGSSKSEWVLDNLPAEDILMEKILFQDVLGCKWRNFRTSDEIYRDFSIAGFKKVEIKFDSCHIFPTVIAVK